MGSFNMIAQHTDAGTHHSKSVTPTPRCDAPAYPLIKHKFSDKILWVDKSYNLSCILVENFSIRDPYVSVPAQNGEVCAKNESVMQEKPAFCNSEVTAFVTSLRACAKNKDLRRGVQLHDNIMKRGLLEKCVDALVTMYATCGALMQGKELLDKHKSMDVFSWTSLITGYARQGLNQDALNCFERMQHEGVSPDAVTFACILKVCGRLKAADKGKKIHEEIARQGLIKNDVVLGTALANMYAKCGALAKAQHVLEELPLRDVVSWNALIAGYSEDGQNDQALQCFEQMQRDGLSPNRVTFISILKVCGDKGTVDMGKEIHDDIIRQGLLGKDVVLGTALVSMYAKCGALQKAHDVLEDLSARDLISWSALIAGYAQQGQGEQALRCYERMQLEGFSPDSVTFACILKACGTIGALDKGEQIHDKIARKGLLRDNVVLGTALVDMYAKCGALSKAQRVLEELSFRDVVAWNALIAGYNQQGQSEQALNCFESMQHEGLSPDVVTFISILKACGLRGAIDKGEEIHDKITKQGLLGNNVVLGTALVDMYVQCGALAKAARVLEELPSRDVHCWSSLIAGYAQEGQGKQALNCFEQMHFEGLSPDAVTFACILKACGSIAAAEKGEVVHYRIMQEGLLDNNAELGAALVDMYAKCGALARAKQVLEELPLRNATCWNALITGYAQQGQGEQALNCFQVMQNEGLSPDAGTFACILKACGTIAAADKGEQIHEEIKRQGLLENDIVLGTALVDMYTKCGALGKAQRVLEELPSRNVVTWNVLIAGYAKEGHGEDALNVFEQMLLDGFSPDAMTFSCILEACGLLAAVDKGEQFHDEIRKRGLLDNDIELGTALVDMYAKCGALAKARQVLEDLPGRNVATWNALITGYAQNGQGEQALVCFEKLQHEGISPDAVMLSCILNVCSHLGLVEDGYMYFVNMSTKYGVKPSLGNYTCIVDLFARAGQLEKAVEVIQEMPSSDHPTVWLALLGACQKWGDVNIARWVFEEAIQIEKSDGAVYILMANIYSAAGMLEDANFIESIRIENKA